MKHGEAPGTGVGPGRRGTRTWGERNAVFSAALALSSRLSPQRLRPCRFGRPAQTSRKAAHSAPDRLRRGLARGATLRGSMQRPMCRCEGRTTCPHGSCHYWVDGLPGACKASRSRLSRMGLALRPPWTHGTATGKPGTSGAIADSAFLPGPRYLAGSRPIGQEAVPPPLPPALHSIPSPGTRGHSVRSRSALPLHP